MYSIKQASIRSGVSVPLIRAWERRYGVVSPERASSGYRLYDDEAIATLVRVRELTETGWSASEASRAVLSGEVAVEVPRTEATSADGEMANAVNSRQVGLIAEFVKSATVMDIAATAAVLDEIFAQGTYESIVDSLLMPALAALGDAWSDGDLDVGAEHAASAAVHRRLSALFEAAGTATEPRVIVGLPPGSRHELGALAFAVAVRRRGTSVLYVGADVPIQSWLHVIRSNRARLAVIAIVLSSDRKSALAVAESLRGEVDAPTLAFGGRSARWDAATQAGIVVLPHQINEAAGAAARLASGMPAAGGDTDQGATT